MDDTVRLHPDPHLRVTCLPVTMFDARVRTMAGELLKAMYGAQGRGFSAPQIGYDSYDCRVFVMDAGWKGTGEQAPGVFVNPEIIWASDEVAVNIEGCLSIPNTPRRVARPAAVEMRWQDASGSAHHARFGGIEAAIVQHELDHLNGVLILDHPEAPQ